LLLVVAVVNVNILPRIAGEGWRSISLWLLAFVLFLIPQGIAVSQFSKRYPAEGGIYIWTREMFGDFHAFLSGWCYWTNNLFYFPSVLFILIGVLVYAGGESSVYLGEQSNFIAITSLVFLWLITFLHIRGLGVGKWLNNIGAIGTWCTLAILVAAGIFMLQKNGTAATPFEKSSLVPSLTNYGGLSAFSIVMYSLVGLELGSVMGDEIKNPLKIVGRAAFWGGAISILLYVIGTAALLIAIPSGEVGAVQGMMQAVTNVAVTLQQTGLVPVFAILISLAVLGICSAWMSGAARIPFVMGLNVYLPPALGKTHSRWNTPYVALIVQAVISSILILLSLYGANVREAYE
ncbi:MAG: APC family permease, partial [Acidobacteriota bacterium]